MSQSGQIDGFVFLVFSVLENTNSVDSAVQTRTRWNQHSPGHSRWGNQYFNVLSGEFGRKNEKPFRGLSKSKSRVRLRTRRLSKNPRPAPSPSGVRWPLYPSSLNAIGDLVPPRVQTELKMTTYGAKPPGRIFRRSSPDQPIPTPVDGGRFPCCPKPD